MTPHWLTVVRSILRDLSRTTTAKPHESQLEQLNITIQQTRDLSGLENISIIEDFLASDVRKKEIDCMEEIFGLNMSADFCSKNVCAVLYGWIAEGLLPQVDDGIRIKRKSTLRIKNDTYSRGARSEMTALFQRKTNENRYLYLSLVIRKEHQSNSVITISELYALFSIAIKQAARQPLVESLEVRMVVVYSRWVQVVIAKTTRSYVSSIVEGQENITGQMEIYQTPWFNISGFQGRQCILVSAFDAIRLNSIEVTAPMPLGDVVLPSVEPSDSSKRKLDEAEEHGKKRKKKTHRQNASKGVSKLI